ncbi:MAG: DUF4336 domain-containing protein [Phormidesmis sp.]
MRALDHNLWVAEQPLKYLGLEVGTRMTVVRLSSQALAVISPIALNSELKQQLARIGTVEHIISPNLYHYLYAADFKYAYPTATFWAAPGLQEKKPNLPIDKVIQANSSPLWNDLEGLYFEDFKTLSPGGFDALNEWVFFHAASRTLILTDTAFHFDNSFPFVTKLLTRVTGDYQKLAPSDFERIATTDKQSVKETVEKILSWDFERVVMAHGSIVEEDAKRKLEKDYSSFFR